MFNTIFMASLYPQIKLPLFHSPWAILQPDIWAKDYLSPVVFFLRVYEQKLITAFPGSEC